MRRDGCTRRLNTVKGLGKLSVLVQKTDHSHARDDVSKYTLEYMNNNFLKVARYSFSGSIPLKFEHKLRGQKQSFGKTATTVVLDKDENLL